MKFSIYKENVPSKTENKTIIHTHLIIILVFLIITSVVNFIFSIIYLAKDMPSGGKWDDILMASIIMYKSVDLTMLSYYDFFDDSDFLNTSVVITFERFLWMVIEVFLDNSKIKIKNLIILQLAISSVFSLIFVMMIVNSIILCCL